MTKAVIIEDEIHGVNNLKNLLEKYCPEVSVIGVAGSVAEGTLLLNDPDIKPDVAFLDINLSDGLVFQLLNQIEEINFEVIFITAYEQFAIKACEYSAIGYVLKPIDPDQLVAAVNRIKPGKLNKITQRLEIFNQQMTTTNRFEKIGVAAIDGIYFVHLKDIIRFEGEDNYTHIFIKGGERITASKTIKAYEDMLTGANFFRVHKSHMINLNFMKKYIKGDGGYMVMEDGKQIDVSRRRRPAFMEHMQRLQEEL
ncbi:MAG TPA: LytTR family DNA-binding domain-containing protein [Saprospiraceae bacterium]|nr:LytTR family DNA-binding domain-containing protein [Saprospiraceae bacterium]